MHCLPLSDCRWYRELVSEVVMSTVLGQRVKVQQGEGTELFNHIDAVVRMSLQLYGHVPFLLQTGGTLVTWLSLWHIVRLIMSTLCEGSIDTEHSCTYIEMMNSSKMC